MHFVAGDFMNIGMIGLVFTGMGGMLLSYLTFGIIMILAVIGAFTVLKRSIFGKKEKNK